MFREIFEGLKANYRIMEIRTREHEQQYGVAGAYLKREEFEKLPKSYFEECEEIFADYVIEFRKAEKIFRSLDVYGQEKLGLSINVMICRLQTFLDTIAFLDALAAMPRLAHDVFWCNLSREQKGCLSMLVKELPPSRKSPFSEDIYDKLLMFSLVEVDKSVELENMPLLVLVSSPSLWLRSEFAKAFFAVSALPLQQRAVACQGHAEKITAFYKLVGAEWEAKYEQEGLAASRMFSYPWIKCQEDFNTFLELITSMDHSVLELFMKSLPKGSIGSLWSWLGSASYESWRPVNMPYARELVTFGNRHMAPILESINQTHMQ